MSLVSLVLLIPVAETRIYLKSDACAFNNKAIIIIFLFRDFNDVFSSTRLISLAKDLITIHERHGAEFEFKNAGFLA